MSTLYLVATPIGNLEDITLRALRILREVDLIAAEDTRTTRKLLSHYDIHTPLTSYNDRNKRAKTPYILERLGPRRRGAGLRGGHAGDQRPRAGAGGSRLRAGGAGGARAGAVGGDGGAGGGGPAVAHIHLSGVPAAAAGVAPSPSAIGRRAAGHAGRVRGAAPPPRLAAGHAPGAGRPTCRRLPRADKAVRGGLPRLHLGGAGAGSRSRAGSSRW